MPIKKILISVLLIIAWSLFATLFYKTIMAMLLFTVWRSSIMNHLPQPAQRKYATRIVWLGLIICLWVSMPRYRINGGDRVRLIYFDSKGNPKHPPLAQYLLSTFVPEEEIMNFTLKSINLVSPTILRFTGIGSSLTRQVQADSKEGRLGNFSRPYDLLGLDNPISGVYPQVFNSQLGTSYRTVYVITPKHYDSKRKYPLVVFCHGYLGNWQLYQGIWKQLDDCIVLSIGTRGLDGIFSQSDINEIFSYYMSSIERMGYGIDHHQLHLMGLSNGGTAIIAAMHSRHAKDFKSITSISCNLEGLHKVPCQVNLIGGGKDPSSCRMLEQYRQLKRMGVDANLYFDEADNHFILVNQRDKIIEFLKSKVIR